MTEETNDTEVIKFCECGCGAIVKNRFKQGHVHKGKFAGKHWFWKGGVKISQKGYRLIYKPEHPRAYKSGYVPEHVLVIEAKLGRPISSKEHTHHINGNKLDNRPENLTIFTNSEHMSHHMKGNKHNVLDMSNRRCCDCDTNESYNRNWQADPVDATKLRCHKCYMKFWRKYIKKKSR